MLYIFPVSINRSAPEFRSGTCAQLFRRPLDLPQQKENSITTPTKMIPPTMPRPRPRPRLLFLFCDGAADVGVLEADTPAEDLGKGDKDKDEGDKDKDEGVKGVDEGEDEVVVTTNISGFAVIVDSAAVGKPVVEPCGMDTRVKKDGLGADVYAAKLVPYCKTEYSLVKSTKHDDVAPDRTT